MSDKKTGGPAFPSKGNEMARQQALALGLQYNEPSGMTLRDYFAAKAMLGIMTDPHHDTSDMGGYEQIAKYAYSLADAMLEARK